MKTVFCVLVIILNVLVLSTTYSINDQLNSTTGLSNQTTDHSTSITKNKSIHVENNLNENKNWAEESSSAIKSIPSTVKAPNFTEICSISAEDFPQFFTREQREKGGFILCLAIGIYCFTLLAIICDKYFLPCVERICEALNLSQDVAAATFMSIATSCPELFTNIIGTFITESDIGIGTIVGSSLFNALGVASIGGLAAAKPIKLDWWPVTRDVVIYISAVSLLVGITWDNVIYWYEGLTLFIVYFVYFTIMFQNVRISKFVRNLVRKNKVGDLQEKPSKIQENLKNIKLEPSKEDTSKQSSPSHYSSYLEENHSKNSSPSIYISYIGDGQKEEHRASTNTTPSHYSSHMGEHHPKHSSPSVYGSYMEDPHKGENYDESKDCSDFSPEDDDNESIASSIFVLPVGKAWKKVLFFYTWPIKLVLFLTIPDPRSYPKLYPVTFLMCILWIGSNSYLISWMITIIGAVLHIPDAVLGLTFLAAGGCLPESISIIIMSRRGEGSMGVSNSLGANTMNILLSLGMPWFFKTILKGMNNDAYITIESKSIEFTIFALIIVAIILYLTLYFNKFRLSKTVGTILAIIYLVCVVLAILSEMVFFKKEVNCLKSH